jgi:hypothetical protein
MPAWAICVGLAAFLVLDEEAGLLGVAAAAADVVGLGVVAGAVADVVGGADVVEADVVAPEDGAVEAPVALPDELEIGLPTQLVSEPALMGKSAD